MIQERRSPSFSKMAVCTANGTTAFSFLVLLDGQGPCHNLVLQCTAVRQVYLFSMVRYDDNHTLQADAGTERYVATDGQVVKFEQIRISTSETLLKCCLQVIVARVQALAFMIAELVA